MNAMFNQQIKTTRGDEHLLLIETLPEKWEALSAFITANHPYKTPEIVAIDSAAVSDPYLEWIKAVLA